MKADQWLLQLSDPRSGEKFGREIEEAGRTVNRLIGDLSVALSWGHFFERLTELERQNLIAWARNMQKIGKGTGKYVGKHRAAARQNMEQCRSAIPAWVMPIYRIAETLEPHPNSFDVVIIDEASQSGPEALFLEYIAGKIIVVGDNKQISPESIGIDKSEVDQLRHKYISDFPHRDNIGVDDSFFDLALIRFPGFIRLREHFRCMPEIIQFSNNLFYAGEPLEPLKQYTAHRLPPVAPCYVDGGYIEGQRKACNPAEAEQLVAQIKKCVADPRYEGKTMGVISLLSTSSQAHEVERRLLDTIGPEEIERRQIICGDPYDFQGDERDIIFLSMVVAPRDASRIATLTGERYARPYNVAASRAKEQMWLFHSVQLKDLSPDCFRYRLIQYVYNPKVEPSNFDHTRVFPDILVEPFESLFEQRIFLKIVSRGYRVIPQLNIAGRRVDLVVEGVQGRLAVECDGDHWHGAEQFESDMSRQRQLERCGWTFWRVRESSFYRDQEGTMSGLWNTLDRLQIFPEGRQNSVATEMAVGDVENSIATSASEDPVIDESLEISPEEVREQSRRVEFDSSLFNEEYKEWTPHPLPDPRKASASEIGDGLRKIIAVEGPVQVGYLFRVYIRGAGIAKLGHQIESVLIRGLDRLIKRGEVEKEAQGKPSDKLNWVVRLSGATRVRRRDPGRRSLDEIPVTEIAALMNVLAISNIEELYRATLSAYGFKRITTGVRAMLEAAFQQMENGKLEAAQQSNVAEAGLLVSSEAMIAAAGKLH